MEEPTTQQQQEQEQQDIPTPPPASISNSPAPNLNKVTDKPEDIRELTIKNLDTGEEFVIGENDPDFEFDCFEIGANFPPEPTENKNDTPEGKAAAEKAKQERISWWKSFFNFIYGSKQNKNQLDEKVANTESEQDNRPRTPFTKLSSFKFRKELGRGAFGRVLLAEARTDGKLYALKIISKKNMRNSDKRQAKAERDILHAMTLKSPHPFTSGLKFAFQSENNLYLGMDYIPGGNLRELIKRFKYLPEDWVRFYAAELVLAISHLHSLNVLYRDIKPHNVMIDARGHVILIDFGLSKQEISHPRGALSLVGTPDYSAPEVLRTGVQQIEAHNREKAMRANAKKKKNTRKSDEVQHNPDLSRMGNIGYGKAADWWSLGIMIYEMLSGKPTFRGSDLRETYQRILYAKLEFVPADRFTPAARQLLEGLINRDPALRLGAWENPPQDIMRSAFFQEISWDGIFERRQDGPWLPELPSFMNNRKSSMKQSVSSPLPNATAQLLAQHANIGAGADGQYIDFTLAPMHRCTVNPDDTNNTTSNATTNNNTNNTTSTKNTPAKNKLKAEAKELGLDDDDEHTNDNDHHDDNNNNDEEDEDDEEEEVSSDDSYQEELAVRDSVFISSKDDAQNRLPDWSYIDEHVLMSYIQEESGKKAKLNKKVKPVSSKVSKKKIDTVTTTATATATSGDDGVKKDFFQQKDIQEKMAAVKLTTTTTTTSTEIATTTTVDETTVADETTTNTVDETTNAETERTTTTTGIATTTGTTTSAEEVTVEVVDTKATAETTTTTTDDEDVVDTTTSTAVVQDEATVTDDTTNTTTNTNDDN